MWTDHKNHKNIEALKIPHKLSSKHVHWAQYFNQFNFTLRYIPVAKNFMADALSRLPQYNSVAAKMIQPVIPFKQLATPVTTRSQGRKESEISNKL